jgi:hypothetical protein
MSETSSGLILPPWLAKSFLEPGRDMLIRSIARAESMGDPLGDLDTMRADLALVTAELTKAKTMDIETSAVDGQLWYPRGEDNPSTITVALYDVRAADDLVIGYDFDRDGWTIACSEEPEKELAFIRSWGDLEEVLS